MRLDEALATVPEGWRFWLRRGPKGESQVSFVDDRGKTKWRNVPYSVYLTNGDLFLRPLYASVTVDGDDLTECLLQAIELVKAKEEKLRKDIEAEKAKGKKK